MLNQNYILLIMNCKKYLNKAAYQKYLWLQNVPSYLQFYHVIGDEELFTNFKFDDENRILWVKTPDDYNSLPKKVIAAYNAVNETFNFKYIFKTDDDQMLINDRFFDILKNLLNRDDKKKIHYGGYIVDVKQNYLSQYHKIHPELPQYLPVLKTSYCSGRFYFLSKEAIESLLKKRNCIENEYLEDYAIGYNLDNQFKSNILNLQTNNYFKDMEII
jgi:hypothetical protein